MTLVIFILILLGISLYLFLKDRRFLNKNLKDNLSDELKRGLNISTNQDSFSKDLETRQNTKQPSQKILEEMNQD